MTIKVIEQPTQEPIDIEKVKSFLRIDHEEEDELIQFLISVAREKCEDFQGRSIAVKTLELIIDQVPNRVIELPRPPAVEIISVEVKDVEGNLHEVDYYSDVDSEPARIKVLSYPSVKLAEFGGFRVKYKVGYEEVPKQTEQAILMQVNSYYDDREALNNKELDFTVQALLRPNRVRW